MPFRSSAKETASDKWSVSPEPPHPALVPRPGLGWGRGSRSFLLFHPRRCLVHGLGPSAGPGTGLLQAGLITLLSMSTLTVFLIRQLQHHVLLAQFMIDLLQVLDVVDGLPQDARLVHLGRKRSENTVTSLQATQ